MLLVCVQFCFGVGSSLGLRVVRGFELIGFGLGVLECCVGIYDMLWQDCCIVALEGLWDDLVCLFRVVVPGWRDTRGGYS